jgi:hypothetical protein
MLHNKAVYQNRSRMRVAGVSDFYRFYKKKTETPVDQKVYRKILREYNEMLVDSVILGADMPLGKLSSLRIVRKPSNPDAPQVDWVESKKLREEILKRGGQLYDWPSDTGEKWIVYIDSKWYATFLWNKHDPSMKVKNKSLYVFRAARGLKSPKQKLKDALKQDDLAYLRFPWFAAVLTEKGVTLNRKLRNGNLQARIK